MYLTKRRLPLGKNNGFAYFPQTIASELYSGRFNFPLQSLRFEARDSRQENGFGLEQGTSAT
jgi:hypothetical protein